MRVFCSAEQRVTSHFQKGALGRCSCTARRFSASDRAATLEITLSHSEYAASGPSALLITTISACSMIPFFSPCSSSPIAGGIRSMTMSTISSIITSDWPRPTVSTITMSYPAASQSITRSLVCSATPPREQFEGEGRTKAFGS